QHRETHTCYHCKKPGHLKKDCRVKTNGGNTYQKQHHRKQNTQKAEEVQEQTPSIFARFEQNMTSVGNTKLRFYVTATTKQGKEIPDVLVDTGSMISSIDLKTVKMLGL
ncbi:hypothetical protein BD770DRAFT_300422, partial [Pilaira anomala]